MLIVNPNNLKQEMNEDGQMMFEDTVTLAVPKMLRILALCYAAIAIVAIILISELPEAVKEDDNFSRYDVEEG